MVDANYEEIDKKNIFIELEKRSLWIDDPVEFSTMTITPLKNILIDFLVSKGKIQIGSRTYFLESLWLEYDFFEANLAELCREFYGSSCCCDKAKFLIRSAMILQETGNIPKIDWKKSTFTYHYPKTGTMEQWMAVIDGLYHMLYGNNKKYLEAIEILRLQHIKESIPLNLNKEQNII